MADADSSTSLVYQPQAQNAAAAWGGSTFSERLQRYAKAADDPESYWKNEAGRFFWQKPWTRVMDFNFSRTKGPIYSRWFEGAVTNICYNCLDVHLPNDAEKVAYYWEGCDPSEKLTVTYRQLHTLTVEMSSVLRYRFGVKKGDYVGFYMPMVIHAVAGMLAVARLGAVANVTFGGFSAEALAARIINSKTSVIITCDESKRANKKIKPTVDVALALAAEKGVHCRCLVIERHSRNVDMVSGRDAWYDDEVKALGDRAKEDHIEWMDAEDPLFALYTSGSTGAPKGLLHTTAGYMVYAASTHRYVFDIKPSDVYFCTADSGWITGHTYVVFGPLLNGTTSILFEGLPTHPTPARWMEMVDRYGVTVMYTAPTAVRSLMKWNEENVLSTSKRSSLRILGSVGEPINVTAWEWFQQRVGGGHVDVTDTWFQTETGGIMITALPGNTPQKPGSATLPLFGILPTLLVEDENRVVSEVPPGPGSGLLCISSSWPGIARTILGDHQRYEDTYFHYDGFYFSGDGAKRDADGYYWITGRVDDVINVSGHRLGTSEIESAVNTNPNVAESAVIGVPHDVKGEAIYVFVVLREGVQPTSELFLSIRETIRKVIGPIATPDFMQPARRLPWTRSGKIMRRILRKVATNETEFGDTSTLTEPEVISELTASRHQFIK